MNIAEGIGWLASKRFAHDGVTVTYARGETELEITAVPGSSEWAADGGEGTTIRTDTADWFVRASDLGALTAPQDGDRISYDGRTFAVMSPGGENPWQWADAPTRSIYRVHTKQVE